MSKLYDKLQSVHEERLAVAKKLNNALTSTFPSSLKDKLPLSTPTFHEQSELVALAQNIAARLPNPDQNVIQFIGSQAGEGTSTLIREFALMVAKDSSKPVLLVEADFKRPSQAEALGMNPKPPLDFALKEGKALDGVIALTEQSNLYLATLSPQFFRSLTERSYFHSTDMWKTARSQFALILIDSSPVSVSPDSLAICETVNGVILVLAAEKTRAAVAQNVKKQILSREGNLLGIVYTKRKFHIPKSIHKLL